VGTLVTDLVDAALRLRASGATKVRVGADFIEVSWPSSPVLAEPLIAPPSQDDTLSPEQQRERDLYYSAG
jgi:hypothetical protein